MAGKKKSNKEKDSKASEKKEQGALDNEIKLASKLAIGGVSELVSELQSRLDTSELIKIDMGMVEQVDTAAMQVLVGCVNTALSKDKKVEWVGQSEVLTASAQTLGLHQFLEFDSEEIDEDDLCPVF